ncbi:MAG: fimbria/pilus periplasmic chaperone [Gammaproteobacteria bacterium]|nr:fimbria/pilus periplasmic chaperone [Gammaproteobacteria bacterium]
MPIIHSVKRLMTYATYLGSALFTDYSWALNVSPMSGDWAPTASSYYELNVVNDTARTLPIKVSAWTRGQDANGLEVRTPTEDLVIFPRQVLLKPNEQRSLRLTQKKKTAPPKVEQAYRIIVEEVPTKDGDVKGSGVRFVSRFVTALYVLPERPRAQIEVVSAVRAADGFTLTLKNTGNTHSLLSRPMLTFKQANKEQVLDNAEDLKPIPLTNLLPGTTHVVRWRWPSAPAPTIDLARDYSLDLRWECLRCEKERGQLSINFE